VGLLTVVLGIVSIDPETIGQVATLITKSYQGILLVPVSSLDHAINL
jgi:hypothetical protein